MGNTMTHITFPNEGQEREIVDKAGRANTVAIAEALQQEIEQTASDIRGELTQTANDINIDLSTAKEFLMGTIISKENGIRSDMRQNVSDLESQISEARSDAAQWVGAAKTELRGEAAATKAELQGETQAVSNRVGVLEPIVKRVDNNLAAAGEVLLDHIKRLDAIESAGQTDNLLEGVAFTNNMNIDDDGNVTQGSSVVYQTSNFIPVRPGVMTYFSGDIGTSTNSNRRVHAYDENRNWIGMPILIKVSIGDTTYAGNGILPDNAAFVRVCVRAKDDNIALTTDATKINVLEKDIGDIKDDYAQQIELLKAVRDALKGGDIDGAVGLLDTYLLDKEVLA